MTVIQPRRAPRATPVATEPGSALSGIGGAITGAVDVFAQRQMQAQAADHQVRRVSLALRDREAMREVFEDPSTLELLNASGGGAEFTQAMLNKYGERHRAIRDEVLGGMPDGSRRAMEAGQLNYEARLESDVRTEINKTYNTQRETQRNEQARVSTQSYQRLVRSRTPAPEIAYTGGTVEIYGGSGRVVGGSDPLNGNGAQSAEGVPVASYGSGEGAGVYLKGWSAIDGRRPGVKIVSNAPIPDIDSEIEMLLSPQLALINDMRIPAVEKERLKIAARDELASSVLNIYSEHNGALAKRMLEKGLFDKYLSVKDERAWEGDAEAEISALEQSAQEAANEKYQDSLADAQRLVRQSQAQESEIAAIRKAEIARLEARARERQAAEERRVAQENLLQEAAFSLELEQAQSDPNFDSQDFTERAIAWGLSDTSSNGRAMLSLINKANGPTEAAERLREAGLSLDADVGEADAEALLEAMLDQTITADQYRTLLNRSQKFHSDRQTQIDKASYDRLLRDLQPAAEEGSVTHEGLRRMLDRGELTLSDYNRLRGTLPKSNEPSHAMNVTMGVEPLSPTVNPSSAAWRSEVGKAYSQFVRPTLGDLEPGERVQAKIIHIDRVKSVNSVIKAEIENALRSGDPARIKETVTLFQHIKRSRFDDDLELEPDSSARLELYADAIAAGDLSDEAVKRIDDRIDRAGGAKSYADALKETSQEDIERAIKSHLWKLGGETENRGLDGLRARWGDFRGNVERSDGYAELKSQFTSEFVQMHALTKSRSVAANAALNQLRQRYSPSQVGGAGSHVMAHAAEREFRWFDGGKQDAKWITEQALTDLAAANTPEGQAFVSDDWSPIKGFEQFRLVWTGDYDVPVGMESDPDAEPKPVYYLMNAGGEFARRPGRDENGQPSGSIRFKFQPDYLSSPARARESQQYEREKLRAEQIRRQRGGQMGRGARRAVPTQPEPSAAGNNTALSVGGHLPLHPRRRRESQARNNARNLLQGVN